MIAEIDKRVTITRARLMHAAAGSWIAKAQNAREWLYAWLEFMFPNMGAVPDHVLTGWDKKIQVGLRSGFGNHVNPPSQEWRRALEGLPSIRQLYYTSRAAEIAHGLNENTEMGARLRELAEMRPGDSAQGVKNFVHDRLEEARVGAKIVITKSANYPPRPRPALWTHLEPADDQRELCVSTYPQVAECANPPLDPWPGTAAAPVRLCAYTDGSYYADKGTAAAAAVPWSVALETALANNPASFKEWKPGVQKAQHPPHAVGAALNERIYRISNNKAEAVGLLTAVLMVPRGSHTALRVVTDSKTTLDGWGQWKRCLSERKRHNMEERAIFQALDARLKDATLQLSLSHQRAHQQQQQGAVSRDTAGNSAADGIAKHLARRNKQADGEPLCLRAHDGHYVVTTTTDHAETNNNNNKNTLHVMGPWRDAIKRHYAAATKNSALGRKEDGGPNNQPPSSPSTAAGYTEDENAVAVRLAGDHAAQHPEDTRSDAFYGAVTRLGRRARGAEGTQHALSAGDAEFFARLASSTLPTLVAVSNRYGSSRRPGQPPPPASDVAAKITEVAKGSPRLRFAFAGIKPPAAAAAADRPIFSSTCPLCACGQEDTQGHFVTCAALQEAWKTTVADAINQAVSASTLPRGQQPPAFQAAIADFLLRPDGHFTRRCGLFSERLITIAFNSAFAPNAPPKHHSFINFLRLDLLRAGAAVFALRQVFFLAGTQAREFP